MVLVSSLGRWANAIWTGFLKSLTFRFLAPYFLTLTLSGLLLGKTKTWNQAHHCVSMTMVLEPQPSLGGPAPVLLMLWRASWTLLWVVIPGNLHFNSPAPSRPTAPQSFTLSLLFSRSIYLKMVIAWLC